MNALPKEPVPPVIRMLEPLSTDTCDEPFRRPGMQLGARRYPTDFLAVRRGSGAPDIMRREEPGPRKEPMTAPTSPRLSVVVPFHNVERFVAPCLESLRRQTMRDFEVVLVDDGSTDGSSERVSGQVAADDRFRVVRQDNHGPGPARNTGIAHARGEFLAFVDSDDLVPRRAYQKMLDVLATTGSDMVAANARRFNALALWPSYSHRNIFEETRLKTSIHQMPELALDRMVWNKVYRRSFWDQADLHFPAMLYEDYPVCVAAHVRANSVDVLEDPVYYWRERDGGELSITQRTWQLDNLTDRVVSAEGVLDMLEESGTREAVVVAAAHLLDIDVAAIIAAVHQNDPAEHAAILGLAHRLLERIPKGVRQQAKPFDRVQAALIEQGRLPELRTLLDHRAEEGMGSRVVTRWRGLRRHYYVELPFFGRDDLVPRECYELPEKPKLNPAVSDAFWRAGRLHLDLDVGLAPMQLGSPARVYVWLQSLDDVRLPLPVERYERAAYHVGRDRTGARVSVDPTALPGWPARGTWRLHVGVRTPQITTSAPVEVVTANRARLAPAEHFPDGFLVQPCQRLDSYGLWIRRPDTVAEKAAPLVDEIELRGWFRAEQVAEPVELVLLTREEQERARLLVSVTPAGGPEAAVPGLYEWSVRIPVAPLIDHGEDFDPVEEVTQWMVRLRVNGALRQIPTGRSFPGARLAQHWRTVSATRSAIGNLVLLEAHCAPRLTDVEWAGRTRLVVRGEWDGPGVLPEVLKLRAYPKPTCEVDVRVPLTHRNGCFRATVDLQELIEAAAQVPVTGVQARSPRPWNILFEVGPHLLTPVVTRDLGGSLPPPRHLDGRRVWLFIDRGDVARLMIRPD